MTAPLLAELKETHAAGRIAEIYEDLRFSLRVPMVNLIFRHLATVPGCLEWFWSQLGPLYVAGELRQAAADLCAACTVPHLTLPLEDSGLDEAARQAVTTTCESYARANPANLVALWVVERCLGDADGAVGQHVANVPRAARTALDALPSMGDVADMPPATRTLLEKLAVQVHGEEGPVIPSFYRHFSAWPSFLQMLYVRLPDILPAIEADVEAFQRRAREKAKALYAKMPRGACPRPSSEATAALQAVIGRFPPNLCKMTLVPLAIKAALGAK